MRAAGFILAALLAAFASVSALQQRPAQTPAFKSGVQLLEVDARVFDRNGRFVETLTIDDFEIIEDGKPQTIQTMFLVGGRAPGSAPAAALDAAAHVLPRAPQTWIFVFDRKHLKPGGYRRAKVALDAFMKERFRAGDLAGIVADEKMIDNRITSVRAEFLSTLAKVRTPGDSAARDADAAEAEVTGGDGEAGASIRDALGILNAQQSERAARDTVELIDQLARGLAAMPGPKTIVLMSDGFEIGRLGEKLGEALRTTVGNMNRAGARVYAVDTRGIAGPPGDATNSLAVDTGGLALFNINDIGAALDQIAADTNTYYVLGYQPLNTKFDGKYRRIDVRVKRPDVTVRARKGYLALAPSMMLVPQPVK